MSPSKETTEKEAVDSDCSGDNSSLLGRVKAVSRQGCGAGSQVGAAKPTIGHS